MDYESFKELVKSEDKLALNKFFAQLSDDPETSAQFVLWALDGLDRMSRMGRMNVGGRYAQMIMEKIGNRETFFKEKAFRKGVSFEKMNDQIQHLNREYVGLRKVLIILLNQHGDLTLSRAQVEETDAYDLAVQYSAVGDWLKFGTQAQARKWKSEEQVAAEIAAEQNKTREQLIEKYGLEAIEKGEQEQKEWEEGCKELAKHYFPNHTEEERQAILWGLTSYSYKGTRTPLDKIEEQLLEVVNKAREIEANA